MASPIYATFHSSEHLVNDIVSNAPAVDPQLMTTSVFVFRTLLLNLLTGHLFRLLNLLMLLGESLVVMVAISR